MSIAPPLKAASIAKINWGEWRSGRPDGVIPGLRLMHSGSWMLQFRVRGKQRKLWLGRMPAMGLRQARQAARKVLEEIAGGKIATGI